MIYTHAHNHISVCQYLYFKDLSHVYPCPVWLHACVMCIHVLCRVMLHRSVFVPNQKIYTTVKSDANLFSNCVTLPQLHYHSLWALISLESNNKLWQSHPIVALFIWKLLQEKMPCNMELCVVSFMIYIVSYWIIE